jgi:hypothetical protein
LGISQNESFHPKLETQQPIENPESQQALSLQLQLIEGSESMGDHDSGSDDWWCVG